MWLWQHADGDLDQAWPKCVPAGTVNVHREPARGKDVRSMLAARPDQSPAGEIAAAAAGSMDIATPPAHLGRIRRRAGRLSGAGKGPNRIGAGQRCGRQELVRRTVGASNQTPMVVMTAIKTETTKEVAR